MNADYPDYVNQPSLDATTERLRWMRVKDLQ